MDTHQNPNLAELSAAGVSVWLDDLSRERLRSGNLQELIDTRSVVGVTTNPSIFQAALSHGSSYDGQVAEHLLLLRGVRDIPPPPPPPRAPGNLGPAEWVRTGPSPRGVDGFVDRLTGGIDTIMERVNDSVDRAFEGTPARTGRGAPASSRILRVQVESHEGDEYTANLPVSLAPHLQRLIPAHGIRALERAGLSIEALQLLIEAAPPPGELLAAEDHEGNSVRLTLK